MIAASWDCKISRSEIFCPAGFAEPCNDRAALPLMLSPHCFYCFYCRRTLAHIKRNTSLLMHSILSTARKQIVPGSAVCLSLLALLAKEAEQLLKQVLRLLFRYPMSALVDLAAAYILCERLQGSQRPLAKAVFPAER